MSVSFTILQDKVSYKSRLKDYPNSSHRMQYSVPLTKYCYIKPLRHLSPDYLSQLVKIERVGCSI